MSSTLVVFAHTDDRTAELDELLERRGRELIEEVRAMGIDVQSASLTGATTNADLLADKDELEADEKARTEAADKRRASAPDKARRSSSASTKAR